MGQKGDPGVCPSKKLTSTRSRLAALSQGPGIWRTSWEVPLLLLHGKMTNSASWPSTLSPYLEPKGISEYRLIDPSEPLIYQVLPEGAGPWLSFSYHNVRLWSKREKVDYVCVGLTMSIFTRSIHMACQLSFTSLEANKKHNHLFKSWFCGSANCFCCWSQCLWWPMVSLICLPVV